MKKKYFQKVVSIFAIIMLMQPIVTPVEVRALQEKRDVMSEDNFQEDSVVVTTSQELLSALSQKKSNITISGNITIGDKADSTGKMYPVEIPEDTLIQGMTDAVLNCRCPIQLTGDNVTIKNLSLVFESSDALGSVPHREIFLAGHNLTMDNVETYLAGFGGSIGGFGGTEEELLPSVYGGGFENTSVADNACLTVVNGNSKTMFKEICMSHEAGTDKKVPYKGRASVKISPEIIVREGIITEQNEDAEILISGAGYIRDLKVYGNENTVLQVNKTNLNRTLLKDVGSLILKDEAYLELQQGNLMNVTLQEKACLDLNKVPDITISGNFTGGIFESEETDTRGILVLHKEGSVDIKGMVENTTLFHTENHNFPGEYVADKKYITAPVLKEGAEGFVLPESKADSYLLIYGEEGFSTYKMYGGEQELVIDSVDIVLAPKAVDISKIKGNYFTPAQEAPFFEAYWKDEEGTTLSSATIRDYGLYFYDTVIAVKTSYWTGEGELEATDWGNAIQFVTSEETPNQYYFYVHESDGAKTGEYTFIFLPEYVELGEIVTVADVKDLKESVKAEMTVYFYDSTEEKDTDVTDIGSEEIEMEVITEQTYTGAMITPKVNLIKDTVELTEGQDYVVTYENSVEVGDSAKAVVVGIGNYCGKREMYFSITKGTPTLTMTVNGENFLQTEYESELCFQLQIKPYNLKMAEEKEKVEFYYNDTLLGTSVIGANGQAIFYYHTLEREIPVGENVVTGKFKGNGQLNGAETSITLQLQKKSISLEEIASVTLKDFEEEEDKKITEILSVTTTEGLTYSASGSAELSDTTPGTYENAKINSWTLLGEMGKWYDLPEKANDIKVSPAVKILEKPAITENPSITEEPSITPLPSTTEIPTITEKPSITPLPSATEIPSITGKPSITPLPSATEKPSITEKPSVTPLPSVTEVPSITEEPSITPLPSVTEVPSITEKPSITLRPSVTEIPGITGKPSITLRPSVTEIPSITGKPSITPLPSVTEVPGITEEPSVTEIPSITGKPSITPLPSVTEVPSITGTAGITPRPSVTEVPNITEEPSTTPLPSVTEIPSITGEASATPQPSVTEIPSITGTAGITPRPSVTEVPNITEEPSTTPLPSVTEAPGITREPSTTPLPSITGTQGVTKIPGMTLTPGITGKPSPTASPVITAIPKHHHKWNSGKVIKSPTYWKKGEKAHICTTCGETKISILTELKAPKKGTLLVDKKTKTKYEVTKSGKKGGTVEYIKPSKNTLKTVSIPEKVKIDGIEYKITSIGPKAFYNCKKLKSVTLGKNIKKIGDKAFYGCKSLKKITIKTTKLTQKNIGKKAFAKVYKKVTVKVPASNRKSYEKILRARGIDSKAVIQK